MGSSKPVSEHELWEYVDGGLGPRSRRRIERLLETDAALAVTVAAMRRQNEALKSIGGEVMKETVPDRLRDVLRRSGRQQTTHKPGCRKR